MLKKLRNFFKENLKYKILSLERLLKFNIYSKYKKNKILFKLYYIIFFISKSYFFFKKNYILIFKKKFNNSKIICIIPRSGNNLLRCILSSYYEISFNKGNGVPKYDYENDVWKFNFEINNSLDLYGASFENKRVFNPFNIVFTQFPINKVNLLDLSGIKPVIVLRNPADIVKSWYLHDVKNTSNDIDTINVELLNRRITNVNYVFKYWENFINGKIPNEDFLIVKFEDLQLNPEKIIVSIFKFLQINFNLNELKIAIEINKKENHIKYMGRNINKTVRFSDFDDIKFKELIEEKIDGKIQTSLY